MEEFLEQKLIEYTTEKIKTQGQIENLKYHKQFLDQAIQYVKMHMDNTPLDDFDINDELRKLKGQIRKFSEEH
jgi:hypothetical protein